MAQFCQVNHLSTYALAKRSLALYVSSVGFFQEQSESLVLDRSQLQSVAAGGQSLSEVVVAEKKPIVLLDPISQPLSRQLASTSKPVTVTQRQELVPVPAAIPSTSVTATRTSSTVSASYRL